MAWEAQQPLKDGTRVAGEDLSAAQYHFVTLEADGEVDLADAATDKPYGVLQNNPVAGQPCEIVLIGFTKLVQSASINPGVTIGTNADGEADAKVVGTDVTEYIVGQMVHNGGADQAIGTAVVNCVAATRATTSD